MQAHPHQAKATLNRNERRLQARYAKRGVMGFELNDLGNRITKRGEFVYDVHEGAVDTEIADGPPPVIKVKYRPEMITSGDFALVVDGTDAGQQTAAAQRICGSALEWDVTRDGVPVPLNEESIKGMGAVFTTWLAIKLGRDMYPKAQAAQPPKSRRGTSVPALGASD